MKILYLVHRSWPYHGGAERYVIEHAAASVKLGHRAVIATTDAWDMSRMVSRRGRKLPSGRFFHRGIEILRFPVVNPPFQNLVRAVLRRTARGGPDRYYYPNPFVPSLDRWLSGTEGFDLVHSNAMPFLLHAGYRYSLKHSVPFIAVPHANLGGPGNRIMPLHYFAGDQPKVLKAADLVIAQNRFEASVYRDECGVDPGRIMVHGSGVEPSEWTGASAAHARKTLSLPDGVTIVLSVTAHCFDKGSFTLLDSSIRLWKMGMDFLLVMAGPVLDDFRSYLDEKSGLIPDGRLVVTGYISEKLRKDLFTSAGVVAAPSRLDAFGIVILDGWMSGTPVVGCNTGGMPDLITEGKDGFLVDFDNENALAGKIGFLLQNPDKAHSMGWAGKEKTLENHTWEKVTSSFFHEVEKRHLWRE